MIRRQQLWMLLAVFALAAALRIGLLGRSGLWADEIFSIAHATGHSLEHPAAAARPELGDFVELDHAAPAEEFRQYLKHNDPLESPARVVRAVFLSDTNPPFYYLLLYGWTLAFGTSDVTLRLFSIACSLACLPLLAGVARRTGGRSMVLPACALFALSPLCIYYSIEVRMYSLLLFLVTAIAWLSLLLHQRGGSITISTLWVVASAAGFLTHYFFIFPWVAMVAFLVVRPGKFERRRLFACVLLTGLAILPWYSVAPESFSRWRVTQGWLKFKPEEFNRWRATRIQFLQFFSAGGLGLWTNYRASSRSALALFAVVAAAMTWRLRLRMFSGRQIFLLLWFVAACTGPIAIDLTQRTYLMDVPRYAIAALPAAYLLAASGLACLRRRARIAMLVLIGLAWAPNVLSIYRNRLLWFPMREIARLASANRCASDLILVHSIPSGVLSIARYAKGPAPMASWVEQLGNRRMPESMQTLASGRSGILFLKIHEVGEPAPEEDWLHANGVVLRETRMGAGSIVEFRPKRAETF